MSDAAAVAPYQEKLLKSWVAEDLDASNLLSHFLESPIATEYGLRGETFSIDSLTMSGIYNYLGDSLNGYYEKGSSLSNIYQRTYGDREAEAIYAVWNGNYTGCAYPENRVSCALDFAAKAMSKTFRDAPYIANGTQGTRGEAFSDLIHVRVTWYWIALPVCMWVLALITFVGTVWSSSAPEMLVWRNSTLPMVFLELDHELKGIGTGRLDGKGLQQRAEKVKGRLHVGGGEIKFAA